MCVEWKIRMNHQGSIKETDKNAVSIQVSRPTLSSLSTSNGGTPCSISAPFGSKHFSQLPLMEYMGYSFHVLVLSIETRDMLHVKV